MANNSVDLLPASLQNTLHQVVDRVNACNGGIRAILLSTAEGVPLGRVYADNNSSLNEEVLSSIESTWAPASKQFPLLNMGKEAKTVTAIYDHGKLAFSDIYILLSATHSSHISFASNESRNNSSRLSSSSGTLMVSSAASLKVLVYIMVSEADLLTVLRVFASRL